MCEEIHKLSLSKFKNIWNTYLSHIKIQTPKTDVCKTWRLLTRKIVEQRKFLNVTDHQKLVADLNEHLTIVQTERAFYKQSIMDATTYIGDISSESYVKLANSRDITMHYSFDFAQQVHIPHDPLQSGPMYFLVPYKVQIFGISNEALKQYHNYLIPESCAIGKGADSVISYLHHYFESYGIREKTVVLHADN